MKAFFTDLDDTLFTTGTKLITPRTAQAIRDFEARGNIFAANSGRTLLSMKQALAHAGYQFSEKSIIVSYNGSLISEYGTGRVLSALRLKKDICRIIFEEAAKAGLYCQSYQSDDTIVSPGDCESFRGYRLYNHLPAVFSNYPVSLLDCDPLKMLVIEPYEPEKLEDFKAHMLKMLPNEINTFRSSTMLLEFVHKDSGKGNALLRTAEILGIDPKDTYAAGDAENDISMIQAAGCGIAMLNADKKVKEAADLITKNDNDHDGLADILETL
ncbi:MAG: Cof-type HAD-IIB family hydrolase [Lachnospiraceae bacterium]|nr:Cof-type HAD-IIB family hydrolase [Lachnospiraceae bacterium]